MCVQLYSTGAARDMETFFPTLHRPTLRMRARLGELARRRSARVRVRLLSCVLNARLLRGVERGAGRWTSLRHSEDAHCPSSSRMSLEAPHRNMACDSSNSPKNFGPSRAVLAARSPPPAPLIRRLSTPTPAAPPAPVPHDRLQRQFSTSGLAVGERSRIMSFTPHRGARSAHADAATLSVLRRTLSDAGLDPVAPAWWAAAAAALVVAPWTLDAAASRGEFPVV